MSKQDHDNNRFLITGGGFYSKGAQAMLFVAVDELSTRFPGCDIYADINSPSPNNLDFTCVSILPWVWKSFVNPAYIILAQIRRFLRKILTDYHPATSWLESRKIVSSVDAIIDISGFALSSQFENASSDHYLDRIEAAKKFNVPVFLLPQSFGPFDYDTDKIRICKRIKDLLPYPDCIYAREKHGYELLSNEYGMKNVILSPDIVLQNKGVDYSHIYKDFGKKEKAFQLEPGNKVAIIPNHNMYRIGKKDSILSCYKLVINELWSKGYCVYLISHTRMDEEICDDIAAALEGKTLYRISSELKVWEFESLITNFDFVICSRYHGIVHSIKNGVPVISLGWAVKYDELMSLFDQQQYNLDVRNDEDMSRVTEVLKDMEINYRDNSSVIKSKLSQYQSKGCFDTISDHLMSRP
ncbi:MAG: polysaccharide pyruvyl transferase family protein [Lachnospiraceae bacterium]|nr:polysaccharide pyruvyl transferase family protein [Lachnospiraceae bacterium]